jgi:hypothetical protein
MQALRSGPRTVAPDPRPPLAGDTESTSRLDTFPSETELVKVESAIDRVAPSAARSRRRLVQFGAAALTVLLALAGAIWLRSAYLGRTGSLRIETDTAGADVTIDDSYRGKTPLVLSLAPGAHRVAVQQGTLNRSLPVTIAGGTTTVHHISWAPAPPPTTPAVTGGLEVVSEPRGQSVTVDGEARGVTPLTLTGLSPGQHEVVIRRDSTTVRRTVDIEAGTTASLMLTGAASGVSSGWLAVAVPIPMQIFEGTVLIGSTQSERILVPAGRHTYNLVNEALGFRITRDVQVTAGQTASLAIPLPRGTINVNATPWAQVWLDGQPLGETPIGNVSWTIGTHDLLLRHPELGERRVTATITTGDPARVAVDMRTP